MPTWFQKITTKLDHTIKEATRYEEPAALDKAIKVTKIMVGVTDDKVIDSTLNVLNRLKMMKPENPTRDFTQKLLEKYYVLPPVLQHNKQAELDFLQKLLVEEQQQRRNKAKR